jgi:methylenetetrahydrofolate reductase (NADH)
MTSLTSNYSIEITDKEGARFQELCGPIPCLTDVAITSLPREEMEGRIRTAVALRRAGLVPIPHLAARRMASLQALDSLLSRLTSEAAVDSVFVIAGDTQETQGPFDDALALIQNADWVKYAVKRIGIAGYPEPHANISQDKLRQALFAKRDFLASINMPYEIVTQFSFDSDSILDWLERLRDAGILAPVKIGVAGPASVKSLLRFASVCGVNASAKVVAKYGFSLAALLGHTGPDALVTNLEDKYQASIHGVARIHFYPFGGIEKTIDWVRGYRQKRTPKGNDESVAQHRSEVV